MAMMTVAALRPKSFAPPPDPSPSPSPPLLRSKKTTYELLNVINRGSFGVVYRARDRTTGQIVAVKHELSGLSPSTKREIDIILSLPTHPSIVELKDLTMDDYRRVFVVMEYMEHDLQKLMESRRRCQTPFTLSEVKFLMKRLLQGVALLHDNGIMHRDLKPANILIDNMDGKLKICDFGLSKKMYQSGRHTPRVGTLWYKAPEVLLGSDEYSCAVHMWSVGCIMAELLLLGQVLFQETSEIRQLLNIYSVLGKPNDVTTCPSFSSFGFFLPSVVDQPCSMLRMKFADAATPMVTECGFDLLERFLNYDPKQRISARDALDHKWFQEYFGIGIISD